MFRRMLGYRHLSDDVKLQEMAAEINKSLLVSQRPLGKVINKQRNLNSFAYILTDSAN